MNRTQVEKCIAKFVEFNGIDKDEVIAFGDTALVLHGVIHECERISLIAQRKTWATFNAKLPRIPANPWGINMGTTKLEVTNFTDLYKLHTFPKYYCIEKMGSFSCLSLNSVFIDLIKSNLVKDQHQPLIDKCILQGAHLLLEVWQSDLESINLHYRDEEACYSVIDDPEKPQIKWKSNYGVDVVGDEFIFLKDIGMMYIDIS